MNTEELLHKYKSLEAFCDAITTKGKNINESTDLIQSSLIAEIKSEVQNLKMQITSAEDLTRKVSIGVVGQVKAGKSSFLNALLFEGKSVLPKAATPMTAALTKLYYSEKNHAVVHFYSNDDWDHIKSLDNQYQDEYNKIEKALKDDQKQFLLTSKKIISRTEVESNISDELKAAHEMMELSKKYSGNSLIGADDQRIEFDDINTLMKSLESFVGANGDKTPFTKYVELGLSIETLKDLEIVDTPGMNDPILSRGRITEQYLKKCDVAFLLSYAGQFMGEQDTSLLIGSLPDEGISRIVLLASKFDSSLLDILAQEESRNLPKLINDLRNKLKKQAETVLNPIIEKNIDKPTFKTIKEKFNIQMISGIAYSIAMKNEENLNEEERKILNTLKEEFPDFNIDKETLLDLANIDSVKDKIINDIRIEKESILRQKLNDIISAKTNVLNKQLSDISQSLIDLSDSLQNDDIQSLKKRNQSIIDGIEECRDNVETRFEGVIYSIDENLDELFNKLKKSARDNKDIEVKTREDSYTISVTKFWNPFSWGKKETRYTTVHYAEYRPVINSIGVLVDEINEMVQKCWKDNVYKVKGYPGDEKLNDFTRYLISSIEPAFDMSDINYNPRFPQRCVKIVLKKLTIPDFIINSEIYLTRVTNFFQKNSLGKEASGIEGSDNIEKLKAEIDDIIKKIIENIADGLKVSKNIFISKMSVAKDDFISNITTEASKELKNLKDMIENKEKYSDLINEIIQEFNQFKKGL